MPLHFFPHNICFALRYFYGFVVSLTAETLVAAESTVLLAAGVPVCYWNVNQWSLLRQRRCVPAGPFVDRIARMQRQQRREHSDRFLPATSCRNNACRFAAGDTCVLLTKSMKRQTEPIMNTVYFFTLRVVRLLALLMNNTRCPI